MKYNEDGNIKELLEYMEKTYAEHYVVDDGNDVGLADLMNASGRASDFYRLSALKYLYRYGSKNGNNKTDLFKAIHLILFLMNQHHPAI